MLKYSLFHSFTHSNVFYTQNPIKTNAKRLKNQKILLISTSAFLASHLNLTLKSFSTPFRTSLFQPLHIKTLASLKNHLNRETTEESFGRIIFSTERHRMKLFLKRAAKRKTKQIWLELLAERNNSKKLNEILSCFSRIRREFEHVCRFAKDVGSLMVFFHQKATFQANYRVEIFLPSRTREFPRNLMGGADVQIRTNSFCMIERNKLPNVGCFDTMCVCFCVRQLSHTKKD